MLITRYLVPLVIAFGVIGLFVFVSIPRAEAEVDSLRCTTSTLTAVTVGNSLSGVILATSSNRAFARIQQARTSNGISTSTVSLAFDGNNATLANGIELSTTTPYMDFGLNTPFPYTGAVQAITSFGSTTLRVTECTY